MYVSSNHSDCVRGTAGAAPRRRRSPARAPRGRGDDPRRRAPARRRAAGVRERARHRAEPTAGCCHACASGRSRLVSSVWSAAIGFGRGYRGGRSRRRYSRAPRRVGVGEARLVVVHAQLLTALVRRRQGGDVAAVADLTAPSGPVAAISTCGQAKLKSAPRCLERVDAVRAAVGLARDERDLRHGRLGVRVQQLRAVADDPAPLLCGTRQNRARRPGDGIRMLNASHCARSARPSRRPLCQARRRARPAGCRRSHRVAVEQCEPADDVRREVLVHLEELPVVDDERITSRMSYGLFGASGTTMSSSPGPCGSGQSVGCTVTAAARGCSTAEANR